VTALSAAANQGSVRAQYHLAQLYDRGENGLAADDAEARRWYERSALTGYAPAMHNLAMFYMEGMGGAANPTLGVQWFRKAAEAGLIDSQYNLARVLEQGQGVPRDPAEAYKWYVIAAAAGDEEAKAAGEALGRTLTPIQRQQAERAAIRFQAAQAVSAQSTPSGPGATALAGQ
jgi:localization factor PodJL